MRLRLSRRVWTAIAGILLVLLGLVAYSFVEPYLIEIKRYEFADPRIPSEFDGTTIVLLADIHRGRFFSQERVGMVVDKANALEPDLVALAGDYVYGDPEYHYSCFEELARLEAKLGRFAVLGNHDYGDGYAQAVEAVDSAGITLLGNRGVWLEKNGARVRVGGVSDLQVGAPRIEPVLEGTTDDDLVILLSHNPDYAEHLPPGRVDVMLSGHTHGGQLTLFGLYAPYLPSKYGQKYRTGRVDTEGTTVFITNGIGSSLGLPVRFFARPQIVEITLRHAAEVAR